MKFAFVVEVEAIIGRVRVAAGPTFEFQSDRKRCVNTRERDCFVFDVALEKRRQGGWHLRAHEQILQPKVSALCLHLLSKRMSIIEFVGGNVNSTIMGHSKAIVTLFGSLERPI